MIWILLILLILTNIGWYLVYDALKKWNKTYRDIIMSTQKEFQSEVLKKMDEISNEW